MVSIERLSNALSEYIIHELATKTNGLKTWALYLVSMSIANGSQTILAKYSDILKLSGYMNNDGSIDDTKLFSDLKKVASETGSVTQYIPMIGDFTFSAEDIELFRRYLS